MATMAFVHGWTFFPLFGIGWLLVLVLLFGFGGRWFWWRRRWEDDRRGSGERVLAERYARGEIDEDEYRRRLDVLKERR
jgi:putative membrane protein